MGSTVALPRFCFGVANECGDISVNVFLFELRCGFVRIACRYADLDGVKEDHSETRATAAKYLKRAKTAEKKVTVLSKECDKWVQTWLHVSGHFFQYCCCLFVPL
jgi:hypothetical protein